MPNMGEFEQMPSEHQLWVNLSSASGGNIFGQIPELIKNMLAPEISDDEVPEDEFHFMLASDYEWRINIYMKLLKKMRHDTTSTEMPVPWREEEEVVKMHHWDILPKPSKPKPCCPDGERVTKTENVSFGPNPITWTVGDIAKAARLLSTPPMKTNFEDEQEMRRVYTLIYDTFRYKGILNQALNDIAFYQLYPTFEELTTRVWLLFFDLYHRSFRKREPVSVETAIKLFPECGLTSIDDALWMHRVKLAAAVARLRIKNSALRLSELLPKHLRDERISCQGKNCPVTCWINPHKVKTEEELVNLISKTLKLKLVDKSNLLTVDSFKWDTLCPNFVSFHHSLRSILARSTLVQKHKLIVQDRSFCLGPATFGKVVFDMELAGNVIQSHVNSPRSTAYLATILSLNSRIASLLVFGAGPRKGEYDSYFQDLGMNNVAIYSEKLIDMAPDSNCLDRVIAVFATPPNSYSAVSDPIDLVCSRGGDLSMLEVLTESEVSDDGRGRVQAILEEQRKTLKFAMSRPQIQVVLYETHSELEVENDGMVQKALKDMNKLARLKHAALQGKIRMPSSVSDIASQEIKEINNNDNVKFDMLQSEESLRSSISKRLSIVSKASAESLEGFDKIYKDINVPDCDLFDNSNLPDLCENADCCLKLSEEGCYLALLQRKEVTKLNNKYMIQMAEVRGLFGNESGESGRNKTGRGSKSKKQEKRPASPPTTKTKRKTKHIEFDRIAAPTDSSIRHSHNGIINNEIHKCPRHRNEEEGPLIKVPQSRRWWSETTRHITNLRESLVNQKILPPVKKTASQPNARTITRTLMHATYKIDEIVAKSSENYNIPVFPRLRLTRNTRRAEKIPLPVPVTYVQFRGRKSAMDSLKNAAADVREMAKQWAEYKKINLGDIRKLDALTKGYISPDESSSSSTLEDPDPPPGPPPSNPHPRPRPQTSPAQFPPIPPPDPLPTSRPTLTFKYINPLTLLERLTRSKDLKGVVSSRPPYISKKPHYPAYGWRFFLEKSYITFPTDEQLDVLTPTEANIDRSSRNLTPSTPSSRGKSRTRQASPSRPEVLEGVLTNPTHTRNTVHMAKINVGSGCTSYPMETSDAQLHHYRADCVKTLKKSCEDFKNSVMDTTIWKFKQPLIARVSSALRTLGYFSWKKFEDGR